MTATAPAPRPRRHRGKIIAGAVGSLIGTVGIAAAAILLTSEITGRATINEVQTSNTIRVSASSDDGSALNCNDISVTPNGKKITFNPVLTKPVGGSNSSNVPVPGGECTVNFAVENTGNTTIRVDASSKVTGPEGWQVGRIGGDVMRPIEPGKTSTVSVELVATEAAKAGAFGGQLVYTDSGS